MNVGAGPKKDLADSGLHNGESKMASKQVPENSVGSWREVKNFAIGPI